MRKPEPRLVIVGQAPSRTNGHTKPLEGPSGRLLEDLAGIERGTLWDRFDVRNLLDSYPGPAPGSGTPGDGFDARAASEAADDLVQEIYYSLEPHEIPVYILLGRAVAVAHGLPLDAPWLHLYDGVLYGKRACMPHPSGINSWYRNPTNRARAERFLRGLLGAEPWE